MLGSALFATGFALLAVRATARAGQARRDPARVGERMRPAQATRREATESGRHA